MICDEFQTKIDEFRTKMYYSLYLLYFNNFQSFSQSYKYFIFQSYDLEVLGRRLQMLCIMKYYY